VGVQGCRGVGLQVGPRAVGVQVGPECVAGSRGKDGSAAEAGREGSTAARAVLSDEGQGCRACFTVLGDVGVCIDLFLRKVENSRKRDAESVRRPGR